MLGIRGVARLFKIRGGKGGVHRSGISGALHIPLYKVSFHGGRGAGYLTEGLKAAPRHIWLCPRKTEKCEYD